MDRVKHLRKNKMKKMGRPTLTPKQFEEGLIQRHGLSFIEDIRSLEKRPFATLRTIAEKYHITRQYVSYVIKRINQKSQQSIRKKHTEDRKRTQKMCACDPRAAIDFNEPRSTTQISRYVKDIILNKCVQNGHEINKVQLSGNIMINNKKVIIRGATKTRLVNPYRYFCFRIPQEEFDIFICHIVPTNQTFLFKREEIGKEYVNIDTAQSCQKRLEKHLEKWDLLQ